MLAILMLGFFPTMAQEARQSITKDTEVKLTVKDLKTLDNKFRGESRFATSFSTGYSGGRGLTFHFGMEYMVRPKIGIRSRIETNGRWFQKAAVGANYHFTKNNHWDVYAYGELSTRRSITTVVAGDINYTPWKAGLGAGFGVRYKLNPSFGFQAEAGTSNSIGFFKMLGGKRTRGIPLQGITNN